MSFSIIKQIFHEDWVVDENFVNLNQHILNSLINKNFGVDFGKAEEKKENLPFILGCHASGNDFIKMELDPVALNESTPRLSILQPGSNNSNEKKIFVLPVTTELIKYDEPCGIRGTETLIQRLYAGASQPGVVGTILKWDCPGGTVNSVFNFQKAIEEVKAKMPVVSYVDGLMASGGVWLGSLADKIVINNKLAQIGSIGVMVAFADEQPALESQGVKFHYITSNYSPDKNADIIEAKKGNHMLIKARLDVIAEDFIQLVSKNRNIKVAKTETGYYSEPFTGKMYFANDAIKHGLADEIGDMNRCATLIVELSEKRNKTNSPKANSNQPNMSKKQYPALMAVIGVTSLEVTEEGSFLSEEMLQSVEAALAGLQAAKDAKVKAENDLTTANTAAKEKDDKITELNTQVADLTNKVTELGKKAADVGGGAHIEGDDLKDKSKTDFSLDPAAQELYDVVSQLNAKNKK